MGQLAAYSANWDDPDPPSMPFNNPFVEKLQLAQRRSPLLYNKKYMWSIVFLPL